ncbi:MAG: glycosyltransferase [Actinomycetota bacterium]
MSDTVEPDKGESQEAEEPDARERMVPETDRETLMYSEHLVRYVFAAQFAKGKRVLDVACGSGYGSQLLSQGGARSVAGVDRSPEAITYSSKHHGSKQCRFVVGDAVRLPFEDDQFDLIVSFETIEHLAEHEDFLTELARVLDKTGMLIISSPNKATYPEGNPFHLRELHFEEFESLLSSAFEHVAILGQDNWVTSAILPAGVIEAEGGRVKGKPNVTKATGRPSEKSLYMVALASAEPLPGVDPHLILARVSEQDFWLEEMSRRDAEIDFLKATLTNQNTTLQDQNASVEHLGSRLSDERARLRSLEESIRIKEQDWSRSGATQAELQERLLEEHVQFQLAMNEAEAQVAQRDLDLIQKESSLNQIHASVAWRLILAYRRLLETFLPSRPSLRRSAYTKIRGSVARYHAHLPAQPEVEQQVSGPSAEHLLFPEYPYPEVSIIVAAHNQYQRTFDCLVSVIRNTRNVAYEVIVVDDASTDGTHKNLRQVENLRLISNASNIGFLRSTNEGAKQARGDYLVFLNNDTEVRSGWLGALIAPAAKDPAVAIVGAKLLHPNETLQEAGGIVWSDGTGWNYGRGDDPGNSEYNYVREVDYCSAACLLVRRDFFEKAGGFDERYTPAYYEDTDLAFTARDLGYKVIYQPLAEVTHHEGASHGTDPLAGGKRFQEINLSKFLEKWASALEQQPAINPNGLIQASDRRNGARALVIDACVPSYDRDSGSLRMDHLIQLLLELGLAVDFLPDNRNPVQPYTRRLQQMGIEVLYGDYDLAARLRSLSPRVEFCIASRPSVAWKYLSTIREYAPNCKFIYDTVDLHFLREQRRADVEKSEGLVRLAEGYKELEMALARAADATIAVTDEERNLIRADAPDASIHVIPNIHEVAQEVRPFQDRSGLLFLGGFDHPPNTAAVQYFVGQILPIIKSQIPDIVLHVVGSNIPASVEGLASPNVVIEGWVEDLDPCFQARRLLVAPITFGAGLKGKITQSLSYGLPVVTTSVGAEGLDLVAGKAGLVADSPEEFAKDVIAAYLDERLWAALSEGALLLAEREYSLSAVKVQLADMLDGLDAR